MRKNLALVYRPRKFSDVVGQKTTTAVLRKNALAVQKETAAPFQQILLSGRSGLGKTTFARIYAAALNCENLTTSKDVCTTCPSCLQVISGAHPDVIEVDAASAGGKDEIKDIASKSELVPILGKYKIYIIDEAHGITSAGNQAFLKLLEEPPPHVVFCLATTDPQKLALPIRSRCREFKMALPTDKDLVSHLTYITATEGLSMAPSVAQELLERTDARGGIRATLMTLEKVLTPLESGSEVSLQDVYTALGINNAGDLEAYWQAILAFDSTLALAHYQKLINEPEPLYNFLLRKTKEDLLKTGNGWRFEAVMKSSAQDLGLLLLTYKLTSSDSAPTKETDQLKTLQKLLIQADQKITELTEALATPPPTLELIPNNNEVAEASSTTLDRVEMMELDKFLQQEVPKLTNNVRALAVLKSSHVEKAGKELVFHIPPQLHAPAKTSNLRQVVSQLPTFKLLTLRLVASRSDKSTRTYT